MSLKVILDTNIWVAAGFNPRSSSARIIQSIRGGAIQLVWDEATKAETKKILDQIPPLSWREFRGLFEPAAKFTGQTQPQDFGVIADPDDRKFAALAAAGAGLISNDAHLLSVRHKLANHILTPEEALQTRDDHG